MPAQEKCTHLLQRPSQRIQLSFEMTGSALLFMVHVGKSHVCARGKFAVKTPHIGSVPQLIKISLPTFIAFPAANGLNLVSLASNETFTVFGDPSTMLRVPQNDVLALSSGFMEGILLVYPPIYKSLLSCTVKRYNIQPMHYAAIPL